MKITDEEAVVLLMALGRYKDELEEELEILAKYADIVRYDRSKIAICEQLMQKVRRQ